jgi:transcriptional regulator with XRE-family HTH domain
VPARRRKKSQSTTDIAERIQSILALKNLTLYQVSQRSEKLYGRSSPYFLPHNLYSDLRGGTFSPSIYQFLAFSRITGYRLSDWLRVFGVDLEDIPRLQVALPSSRTILLDSSLADPFAWVPWLRDRIGNVPAPPIAPLGQLLELSRSKRLRSLSEPDDQGFLYAKIGYQDALAFPDLLPGSIVRVNPDIPDNLLLRANGTSSRIFLIEHHKGFFCCRLRAIGDSVIVPVSTQLSYAQVELRRPHETRLLGIVDLEIRPLLRAEQPKVPKELAKQWKPHPLSREENVGSLLHRARITMRLSLREASGVSRKIADLLGDGRYFISPSSLCDYELLNTAPRHIQKAITLCSLYGLRFQTFLKAIGIVPEEAGGEPMPDHFVSRFPHVDSAEDLDNKLAGGGFLEQLLERCEEVPFFLRESVEPLSGLGDASLNDFFWVGGKHDVLHPYLTNGLLALVNRRKKKPFHFTSKPLWQQPLYVLLKRGGTYLCACCGIENGTLVVHPYSQHFQRPEQFRYRHDVEVVGQIVMIARKLV